MSQKNGKKSKLARITELFLVSLKLGLTSFGGPTAHLAYFHQEYVQRRKWLDEKAYADLVALCQFLPGPASSQVGISIGMIRAGIIGGIVSFLGFTLPSVLLMSFFAFFLTGYDLTDQGWIHGLKIVAVIIVLQAVIGMGKKLATGKHAAAIAALAAAFLSISQTNATQLLVIIAAAIAGFFLFKMEENLEITEATVFINKKTGILALTIFLSLLVILPFLAETTDIRIIQIFDSFYRSGALVFGGGHVVLPLLEKEFIPEGFIEKDTFLAGYGAAQAIPGPLFTFSAYLGAIMKGWFGVIAATIAIFLPAFLLVIGTLPFWNLLRRRREVQGVLRGVNAAVVGILLAALYDPIFVHSIQNGMDFSFAVVLFALLNFWKMPPWVIVILGLIGGLLFL